jgi:hypothetical protein
MFEKQKKALAECLKMYKHRTRQHLSDYLNKFFSTLENEYIRDIEAENDPVDGLSSNCNEDFILACLQKFMVKNEIDGKNEWRVKMFISQHAEDMAAELFSEWEKATKEAAETKADQRELNGGIFGRL